MSKRVLKNILKNGNEYEVGNIKLYVITEDIVSVSTDETKGVSPYNTSYGYTNITIDENSGIKWKEGAVYAFVINTEMVVASAYRNIRVRIGTNGTYIPVMNAGNSIMAGSSYFTKSRTDLYVYKTTNQSGGALHMNNDTSYSTMSVAEGKTGTATSARTVRADYLKQIIEYFAGNLDSNYHDSTKYDASNPNGYTSNVGTITGITMNGSSKGTSGVVNLGTVITQHQDISGKQDKLTAGEGITIDENNVISAEGGGGGADTNTINALIDVKLKDSDPVFQITSGLYKILNDMDSTDSCGLTEGDSRAEIVANEISMNLISHSWNIMSKVVSSDTAMTGIVGSSTAKTQMIQSWKAMELIMNSSLAVEYFSDTTILSSVLSSAVGLDALRDSDIAIEILSGKTLTQSLWNSIMGDSIIGPKVANNNELLESISKNESALKGLISNSTAWGIVTADYEKINICVRNNGSVVIANDTASDLNGDNSLRAIINNNLLDSYIAKGEGTSNNVIVFDIDSSSATSFGIARYGYSGGTSTWKISVDGGAWDSQSVAASSTALSINLGSTGKHTIVIKPGTLAVGWAKQMGNRTTTNYWTNTGLTFKVRNLPGYAFTTSTTATQNYFLYYTFYGCTTLTEANVRIPSTLTSTGTYFMGNTFYNCSNLTKIGGNLNVSGIKTAGNYYLYQMCYGCSKLTGLPSGWNLSTITTSIGTYFMYYTFYNCSTLAGLPTGFKLPTVGNSSYYMRYTWASCSALTSNSPAENLTFVYAASYCFNGSGISTTSPSAGSSVAVHRV